jgi:hypothetical protein
MLKNKAFAERTTFLEENFLSTGSFDTGKPEDIFEVTG